MWNCSPPVSFVHGIHQSGILEWVAHSSPGDLPDQRFESRSPTLQADSLPSEPSGKPVCIYNNEYLYYGISLRSEKAMAAHSSTLAWKIPWTEEPGRLQSMGSLRVVHNWATSLSLFTFMHCRRKWQPTPMFLPGESQGWRGLVGCRLWDQCRTRLKWLSSSSSISLRYIHIAYTPLHST